METTVQEVAAPSQEIVTQMYTMVQVFNSEAFTFLIAKSKLLNLSIVISSERFILTQNVKPLHTLFPLPNKEELNVNQLSLQAPLQSRWR